MNNKELSEQTVDFKDACVRTGLPKKPFTIKNGKRTSIVSHSGLGLGRQAGKWRRKKGLAYKEGRKEVKL